MVKEEYYSFKGYASTTWNMQDFTNSFVLKINLIILDINTVHT